jgi:hypothetical protein
MVIIGQPYVISSQYPIVMANVSISVATSRGFLWPLSDDFQLFVVNVWFDYEIHELMSQICKKIAESEIYRRGLRLEIKRNCSRTGTRHTPD